jgi:hypothetical protein
MNQSSKQKLEWQSVCCSTVRLTKKSATKKCDQQLYSRQCNSRMTSFLLLWRRTPADVKIECSRVTSCINSLRPGLAPKSIDVVDSGWCAAAGLSSAYHCFDIKHNQPAKSVKDIQCCSSIFLIYCLEDH